MPHVPDTGPGKRVTGTGARTDGREASRQTSEVGAVCRKAARTDLCGGRPVMDVPTAIRHGPRWAPRRRRCRPPQGFGIWMLADPAWRLPVGLGPPVVELYRQLRILGAFDGVANVMELGS